MYRLATKRTERNETRTQAITAWTAGWYHDSVTYALYSLICVTCDQQLVTLEFYRVTW